MTAAIGSTSSSISITWDAGYITMLVKLGRWVTMLQNTLSLNGDNLPLEIVNPTTIAETGLVGDVQKFLNAPPENAVLKIDYHEGFPTVDGIPVWERLDGELIEHYNLFKQYRELREATGQRSVYALASGCGVAPAALNALKEVYHWKFRSQAYDSYKLQLLQATRERNIATMESSHLKAAKSIFKTCLDYMDQKDIVEKMSPKEALEWFKTAAELERLALGLHPQKPSISAADEAKSIVNVQVNNDNREVHNNASTKSDNNRLADILEILAQSGALGKAGGAPVVIDVDLAETSNGTGEVDEIAEPTDTEDIEEQLTTKLPILGGEGDGIHGADPKSNVVTLRPHI